MQLPPPVPSGQYRCSGGQGTYRAGQRGRGRGGGSSGSVGCRAGLLMVTGGGGGAVPPPRRTDHYPPSPPPTRQFASGQLTFRLTSVTALCLDCGQLSRNTPPPPPPRPAPERPFRLQCQLTLTAAAQSPPPPQLCA